MHLQNQAMLHYIPLFLHDLQYVLQRQLRLVSTGIFALTSFFLSGCIVEQCKESLPWCLL